MSKVGFVRGSSEGFGWQFVQTALKCGDQIAVTARATATLSDVVEEYDDLVLAPRPAAEPVWIG